MTELEQAIVAYRNALITHNECEQNVMRAREHSERAHANMRNAQTLVREAENHLLKIAGAPQPDLAPKHSCGLRMPDNPDPNVHYDAPPRFPE